MRANGLYTYIKPVLPRSGFADTVRSPGGVSRDACTRGMNAHILYLLIRDGLSIFGRDNELDGKSEFDPNRLGGVLCVLLDSILV